MRKIISVVLCCLLVCLPLTASAKTETETSSDMITQYFENKWNVKTSELHPELRFVGNAVRLVLPNFTKGFFKLANFFLDNFGQIVKPSSKTVKTEVKYIEREDGTKLRVCIYAPSGQTENLPGRLWIHGGGYAIGIPEQDLAFIKCFMEASPCVIVAPDYINSTDAPYPAAFNDCYNSLLWLEENADALRIKTNQIFVGGNSAGGGLCAAVTLKARDAKDVNIAFQMPIYPMLDDRMITESSQNNDAPMWNTKSNEIAWQMYLGEDYKTDKVSKYAAPARETDYSDLPPTLTYIGTVEPFYDETNLYVDNLKKAGIDVQFKVFEGCFHGFDLLSWTTPAKEAREFLADGFKYATENYFAQQEGQ